MKDKPRRSSPRGTAPRIFVTPAFESPGKLLHDAHLRLSAGFGRALREAGHQLPIDAWAVLNLLWEQDNLPQFEIAARIGRDRHQTSRLIDSLDQAGLVSRRSVPEDRRIKRVVLTSRGRAARSTLGRLATRYLEDTFTGVSQRDYDGFIRCLQHIVGGPKPNNEPKETP